MNKQMKRSWMCAIVVANVLGAGALSATTTEPVVGDPTASRRTVVDTTGDPAEVEELEARAERLARSAERRDWRIAAGLLRQAAHLRLPGDLGSVESLRVAGRIYHHLEDGKRARSAFLEAAELAVTYGDVEGAAHAYLDAASVAAERGEDLQVHELARKAALLSGSPLLTAAEREAIRSRIDRGGVRSAGR